MDLTSYILPYPYEAYTEFERRFCSFEEYKSKIYNWVAKNSSSREVNSMIDYAFSVIEDTKETRVVKNWLLNHKDKLRYIGDFSGLGFGIQFCEDIEKISIRYPSYISDNDKQLYPLYDENEFKNMKIIDRLEWLYLNCEFIPFRVIKEDIEVANFSSYKFSHIKRDKYIMNLLKDYLDELKFYPSDSVYYFIEFSSKTKKYYLKRDLEKSPKKEVL